MWRCSVLLLACCLSLISNLVFGEPCSPNDRRGLAWKIEGTWQHQSHPVQFMDAVDVDQLRAAQPDSKNKVVVLLNGRFLIRTYTSDGYQNECRSPKGSVPIEGHSYDKVVNEAKRPQHQPALSRASGWNDVVVGLGRDGTIDLADVFRGSRARAIRFRFCSTEPSNTCDAGYLTTNWDGQTAAVTSDSLTAGLFRIVEDDGASDAWVRVIESERAAAARAEYQAAIEALKSWRLPDSETSLPTLDRLRRPILASVGASQ